MLYNVSQLLKEPTGSTRRFSLDEPVVVTDVQDDSSDWNDDTPGLEQGTRATGTIRLLRTHQGLLVYASLHVQMMATCSRCLAPCAHLSELDVEEECFATVDPATGRNMKPPDESEGVVHIDTHQMLDLNDVLRQYILTDQPLKVLCRPDCRGLCSECGTDLNTNKCSCDLTNVDPRWGSLMGLLSADQ